jgi:hypothetical protein
MNIIGEIFLNIYFQCLYFNIYKNQVAMKIISVQNFFEKVP